VCPKTLTEILPYQVETEEREHGAGPEYIHVLRAGDRRRLYISAQTAKRDVLRYVPSPLDPTDDISTEAKRIGGIAEATLRALEHGTLIHETIEHLPTLREKVVQPRLRALQKRVLLQRVLLPTGT
jgi:hypothetical protein